MAPKKKDLVVSEVDRKRKESADNVIAAILKVTKQSPLGASIGTWPHIPSGTLMVDNLIGGEPLPDGSGMVCPGYPKGRIIEIFGPESSGKTTLALASIVSVQKAGGLGMFLDFENALHHGYSKAIGVDFSPDKLLYYSPANLEEGLKMMYCAIKQNVGVIVVDSLAAMVPAKELAKDLNDPAAIGALARAMSGVLPKMVQWLKASSSLVVFLNQTRSVISSNPHAGTDNTAGGKAVKFYASLRLGLTRVRTDSVERADPITLQKKKLPYGNLVQVKVVKNKMAGTQGHSGTIFIRYGVGVDEYLSMIEGATPRRIITQSASTYKYNGQSFKGRDSLRKYLIDNPKAFEDVKAKVIAALMSETPKILEDVSEDDVVSDCNREVCDDDIYTSGGIVEEIERVCEDI